MFKLPMDENLRVFVTSVQIPNEPTSYIRCSDLNVWDELPMTHRYCVEALNRTLQDITRNKNLFGGKTILFSGDWRQIGPVTKGSSSPTDTVDVAFISSHLWNHVQRLRLTISQRDKEDPQYADFVQRVEENKIPLSEVNEQPMMPLNNHCLPNTEMITFNCNSPPILTPS